MRRGTLRTPLRATAESLRPTFVRRPCAGGRRRRGSGAEREPDGARRKATRPATATGCRDTAAARGASRWRGPRRRSRQMRASRALRGRRRCGGRGGRARQADDPGVGEEMPGRENSGDRDGHGREAAAGRQRHCETDGADVLRGLQARAIEGGAVPRHKDGGLLGRRGRRRRRQNHSLAARGPPRRRGDAPDKARNRRPAVHLPPAHGEPGDAGARRSPARGDVRMGQAERGCHNEEADGGARQRGRRDREDAARDRRRTVGLSANAAARGPLPANH